MTWLVVVETLVLALLALLVAGLLRSHAEILRRLDDLQGNRAPGDRAAPGNRAPAPDSRPGLDSRPGPASRPDGAMVTAPSRGHDAPGQDILGVTLRGDRIKVAVRADPKGTLLAFLSTGCATCQVFWDGLQPMVRPDVPGGARLILVTKDSSYESPSKLRQLAPPDVPLVMSSDAWEDYGVPGSPYFVHVDGSTGQIRGEGMAQSWPQVLSLLGDALADATMADERGDPRDAASQDPGRPAPGRGFAGRLARVDAELAAAGIGEGHPSLYGPDDARAGGRWTDRPEDDR